MRAARPMNAQLLKPGATAYCGIIAEPHQRHLFTANTGGGIRPITCPGTNLGPGEWTASFQNTIGWDAVWQHIEFGLCPACGRTARRTADGWRRCSAAGEPYPVEFQIRSHGVELIIVYRHFTPEGSPTT